MREAELDLDAVVVELSKDKMNRAALSIFSGPRDIQTQVASAVLSGFDDTGKGFRPSDFPEKMKLATKSAAHFDGLNTVLASRLLDGPPLTEEMKLWVAGVLTGRFMRPKSAGGPSAMLGKLKGLMIASLVFEATKRGLKPYRSPASPAHSACDAVVALLSLHGHHTSYDTVV